MLSMGVSGGITCVHYSEFSTDSQSTCPIIHDYRADWQDRIETNGGARRADQSEVAAVTECVQAARMTG